MRAGLGLHIVGPGPAVASVALGGVSGHGYDADAEALFTATGLTDATEKSAYNTFILGLKSDSLWSLLDGLWLFVGSTASSHKYNAKDPRDLDAAFRLTFHNSPISSSTGVLFNGTSNYARTYYAPANRMTTSEGSFGVYGLVNVNGGYDFSVSNASDFQTTSVMSRYSNTQYGSHGGAYVTTANSNSVGFFCTNRKAGVTSIWNNGVKVGSSSPAATLPASGLDLWLGCQNRNGSAIEYKAGKYCLAYACPAGLSDADMASLYSRISTLLTSLGRI